MDDTPRIDEAPRIDDAQHLLRAMPCGLLAIDLEGRIAWANDAFPAILGNPAGLAIPGAPFHELLSAHSRIIHQTHVQPTIFAAGSVDEVALSFNRPARSPLRALVNFKLERNPDGTPSTILACVFPAERQADAEHDARAAKAQSRHLAAIVSASSDAIFSLGLDLEIQTWNQGAANLLGYDAHEAIGQRADLLLVPDEGRAEMLARYAAMRDGQPSHTVETARLTKTGRKIDVEINAAPILDKDARAIGFAVILRDATERRAALEALHTSRSALKAALDVAQMATWGWNDTQQVKQWSREALAIVGLPTDAAMTTALFLSIVHPDDHAASHAAWAAALDPAGPRTYDLEYRVRRADDGAERLISSKAVVEFTEHGQLLRVVGALRDITEERAAQDHIAMLLDEMNHRAKNLLTIVQVVAQQTARNSDPASFVDRLSHRLKALAINQDILIRNTWSGAEIRELLRSQLLPFIDHNETRIDLQGPPARLSPQAAQAIGMAMHELATNAAKYGALSNQSGRIRIAWDIEPASPAPLFRMSWSETDGPRVSEPTRRGFGQIVLGKMVGAAVNGQTTIDYAPTGLNWHLQAPATSVSDRANHR